MGDKDRLSDDWLLSVLKKHEVKHESSVPDPASSSDSDENGSGQSGTSSTDPEVPGSSDTPTVRTQQTVRIQQTVLMQLSRTARVLRILRHSPKPEAM
jgi:hypothetical protein